MGLAGLVKDNWNFLLAAGSLVAASGIDYFSTMHGISTRSAGEANEILNFYINNLGLKAGILIPKAFFVSSSLVLFSYADSAFKNDRKSSSPKYPESYRTTLHTAMYSYAGLTAVVGLSWLLKQSLS